MRIIVTGVMAGLIAATPAHAERYAIRCNGNETMALASPGVRPIGATGMSRKSTYVIDESAQTIEEYDPRKRSFTPVCPPRLQCTRSFSAERIAVRGGAEDEKGSEAMLFDWDRGRNRLETGWDRRVKDGLIMVQHATLRCKPAKMPVAEVSK